MPWYRALHWQILLGLALGLVFGLLAAFNGWAAFVRDWIAPWGTLFINALRLMAVPLVLTSLAVGVASLRDLKTLSRIGGKTVGLYLGTTALAVMLGLLLVNVVQPGRVVPPDLRDELMATYAESVTSRQDAASAAETRGPLQFLVEMLPENVFSAASSNSNMLQVVVVALLLGIGLIQIRREKAQPVLAVLDGLNDVIIRLVEGVMRLAPVGVFALLSHTLVTTAGDDPARLWGLLTALALYMGTVVVGLALQTFGVYPLLLRLLSPMRIRRFFQGFAPAQLVAFSTSSSGATLPVSMECAEKRLGVREEVTSFVMPLGATINMDGTALYQAVAAVFIAQAIGIPLDLGAQATIVLTATLASIGTAAVPGAGLIMLVIILEAIGVPSAGLALILGVDRILDMLRTVTNVTGDATVATIVAASEGQLLTPQEVAALDAPSPSAAAISEPDLRGTG